MCWVREVHSNTSIGLDPTVEDRGSRSRLQSDGKTQQTQGEIFPIAILAGRVATQTATSNCDEINLLQCLARSPQPDSYKI